jgi:hypothetical protein
VKGEKGDEEFLDEGRQRLSEIVGYVTRAGGENFEFRRVMGEKRGKGCSQDS